MSRTDTGVNPDIHVALMSASDAAQALDISSAAVRKMAERGDLPVAQKLAGRRGMYLFRQSDIEVVAAERRAELEARLARMKKAVS